MERQNRKSQILNILAKSVRRVVEEDIPDFDDLQEIRLRTGKPLIVIYRNREVVLPTERKQHITTKEEIRETMEYISHYSLYAYENELRQGFLTVEGGHRVGVSGKVIVEKDKVKNIQHISSVNIRMSHEVIGCADGLLPYITKNMQVCHTLIISPPRCGKTTLIRDLIRQISNGNAYVKGSSVGVVDERSELGGCYLGVAQNDLGIRTDILDCCPKAEGMIMLIRSMAPQVIAVDEIGTSEDIHAIEYAMQCGCKLIASVHGLDMQEASESLFWGNSSGDGCLKDMWCWETANIPGKSGGSMMSGGVCCAETGRRDTDYYGHCRSRICVWDRIKKISGKNTVSPIYSGIDERRN